MEFSTLALIAIILPFFIQFHYLLADPWKLCKAFHYYSSVEPKKNERLIMHYPKLPNCNFTSNSISNTSVGNKKSVISIPVAIPKKDDQDPSSAPALMNFKIETSSSLMQPRTEISHQTDSQNSATISLLRKDDPAYLAIKSIAKKTGNIDFGDKKRGDSVNSDEIEYLFSRDLFIFEYRKRPEMKTEGTQFEKSENKQTLMSRHGKRKSEKNNYQN